MTTPGGAVTKYVLVTNVSTGAGVTGLTLSDFTVTAWAQIYGGTPAAYSVTPTVTPLGSGYYAIKYALGPAAGYDGADIVMVSSSNAVRPVMFSGEVETYDLTALAALIPSRQGGGNAVTGLGQQLPITLQPYRYAVITYTVTGVDLTQFSNFCLSFRDQTQQAFKIDLWFSASIWNTEAGSAQGNLTFTGTSGGLVTITLPQSLVGPVYIKWEASQPFKLGDRVSSLASPNGVVFVCTTPGTTGGSEPSWNTTAGVTTTDNTAVWTALVKSIWTASTAYIYGQYVTPQANGTPATGGIIMRCVTPGSSGSAEPTWGTTPSNPQTNANFITDGTVKWQVFNDFYGILPEGTNTVNGYWELTGQNLTTGKMESMTPSSPLTITRREVGT
jgi:hypothetical protein